MRIYTDGSTHPTNPGPGGFAVVIVDDDDNLITTHSEQCDNTTNNREEIKAILWAFLKYGSRDHEITVYSDSAYCVSTFNIWMFKWALNGWIKSDKKTPENLDLIQTYFRYWQRGYKIDLQKIKGHAGHKWNELADKLARGDSL